MAKGRKTLADTVNPDDIIYSGEIVGKEPNVVLPDKKKKFTYGIVVDTYGYNLAVLKDCHRSEKDEDGNEKIVHYNSWKEISYHGDISGAFYRYVDLLVKSEDAKLRKCKSIQELVSIRQQIKDLVSETFPEIVSQSIEKECDLIQEDLKLKEQIEEAKTLIKEMKNVYEEFMGLIKEKRKILIQETEPKKHRLKLED